MTLDVRPSSACPIGGSIRHPIVPSSRRVGVSGSPFQRRAVVSYEAVTMRVRPRENAAEVIAPLCPSSAASGALVVPSNSRPALSLGRFLNHYCILRLISPPPQCRKDNSNNEYTQC
jgi:hypothetical protein